MPSPTRSHVTPAMRSRPTAATQRASRTEICKAAAPRAFRQQQPAQANHFVGSPAELTIFPTCKRAGYQPFFPAQLSNSRTKLLRTGRRLQLDRRTASSIRAVRTFRCLICRNARIELRTLFGGDIIVSHGFGRRKFIWRLVNSVPADRIGELIDWHRLHVNLSQTLSNRHSNLRDQPQTTRIEL